MGPELQLVLWLQVRRPESSWSIAHLLHNKYQPCSHIPLSTQVSPSLTLSTLKVPRDKALGFINSRTYCNSVTNSWVLDITDLADFLLTDVVVARGLASPLAGSVSLWTYDHVVSSAW